MADIGEDEEHRRHPKPSDHQGLTTTVMLDNVEAIEGCAEVDAVQDHLGDIGVVDTSSLRKNVRILLIFKPKTQSPTHLEDCGSVVEEVIGTCELLEHL